MDASSSQSCLAPGSQGSLATISTPTLTVETGSRRTISDHKDLAGVDLHRTSSLSLEIPPTECVLPQTQPDQPNSPIDSEYQLQKERYNEQCKEAAQYSSESITSQDWISIRQALIRFSLQLSIAEHESEHGSSELAESSHIERLASIDKLNHIFYTNLEKRRRLPTRQFQNVYWQLRSERSARVSDQSASEKPRKQTFEERQAFLNKRVRDEAREQLRDEGKKERYKAELVEQAHRKEALRKSKAV
ncbi:hypothetical protein LTS18_001809 [Coniosporium uncinatum]|uniref:Uncharacterized protein n=1 Tax=Coniosporium uncinatum TaxID=93489 RepID=A0ACC3DUP4_9PEZI|nr:hypothetical protein LTS18_001809 [Coniosporium uncinatum]